MDKLTLEQRRKAMQAVKGKDTVPEILIRKYLHSHGYRFRLHRKDLPGKPDIVLPKIRTVVFVNGCFWHRHPGCEHASMPVSNIAYWEKKFNNTIRRDKEQYRKLRELGWKVVVIWECEIKSLLRSRIDFLRQRLFHDHYSSGDGDGLKD